MSISANTYYTASTIAEIKGLTTRPSVIQSLEGNGVYNWTAGSTLDGDDVTVIEPTSPTPAGRYILEVTDYPLTVEDLAALKALTSRPESVLVKTGQAAGVWQWVAGSSTIPDDLFVVEPTSGTAGRYKRIVDDAGIVSLTGNLASPTQKLRQQLAMYCTRAGIFTGSERAPQGAASVVDSSGDRHVIIKQRVATAGLVETFRLVMYPYVDDGTTQANTVFTGELTLGHQGLGAYYSGANVVCWTSSDSDSAAARYGVSRIATLTVGTTQANVTSYKLFNEADPNHYAYKMITDSGLCSDDGEWVIVVASNIENYKRSDAVSMVFVYLRSEVEAAGSNATGVLPIYEFKLEVEAAIDADCFQDFSCPGVTQPYFYAYCGQSSPLGRHYVQEYSVSQGNCLMSVSVDDARAQWTRAELLDEATYGLPSAMEPEGIFSVDDGVCVVTQEVWGASSGPIVTSDGLNWASLFDSNTGNRPGWNDWWTETTTAATVGAWNSATTYAGLGADTLVRCVITKIKPADGDVDEKPLDNGLLYPESTANNPLASNTYVMTARPSEPISIGYFTGLANTYYPLFTIEANSLNVYDATENGAGLNYGYVIDQSFTEGRQYARFRLGGTGIDGGNIVNYGSADSVNPSTVGIFPTDSTTASGFLVTEAEVVLPLVDNVDNIGSAAKRVKTTFSQGFGYTNNAITAPTNGSTITPDPQVASFQSTTNNVAGFTLAPSANLGSYVIDITNGASAGTITTSGFTMVTGDTLLTTNTFKYRGFVTIGSGGSTLTWLALQ